MKRKKLIVGEWIMRITGPAQARPGRVRVEVSNTDARDRRFAQALTKVIEVWLASCRRRVA